MGSREARRGGPMDARRRLVSKRRGDDGARGVSARWTYLLLSDAIHLGNLEHQWTSVRHLQHFL